MADEMTMDEFEEALEKEFDHAEKERPRIRAMYDALTAELGAMPDWLNRSATTSTEPFVGDQLDLALDGVVSVAYHSNGRIVELARGKEGGLHFIVGRCELVDPAKPYKYVAPNYPDLDEAAA
jgi:hypothetical protein